MPNKKLNIANLPTNMTNGSKHTVVCRVAQEDRACKQREYINMKNNVQVLACS